MKFFHSPQPRQGGMAVIVVLAFLSLMLIYIAANMRSLYRLEREMKLTERRQIQRLEHWSQANASATQSAATNSIPAAPGELKTSAH